MFSSMRKRLRPSPAGAIAVAALVFAMVGGAFAANGGENSNGGATASAKASKGKQGKPGKPGKKGATGATGPQGPAGSAGPAGPVGPAGAKGDAGQAGTAGAKGATGSTGANGIQGLQGPTGPTGPVGTVPSGTELKGTWSLPQFTAVAVGEIIPISFSTGIPVSTLANVTAIFVAPAEQNNPDDVNGCIGSAVAPVYSGKLGNGFMCVYEEAATALTGPALSNGAQKVRKSGGGIVALAKSADPNGADPDPASWTVSGYGSWVLATP